MASKSKTANIGRLSEIVQVAVKHGFGSLLEGRRAPAEVDAIRGRHLREMFDELGPTFVKFGQLLSTRPDIVPEDIIVELRGLQNDVTPFPFADVQRVIAEDLKQPISRLFVEFDETPMAAASIGQVHRALLPNGIQVAVKVQRPNAPRQVESDIQLLEQAARFIKERVHQLDFVDIREVVDEFARSLRQELDYRQEASNAQAFHRNFAGHPHVVVPRLYRSYSSQRVLTLEYLEGVQLADLEADEWSMDERRRLAYVIAETWLTMIFRHGFFHGDPHPANILVPHEAGMIGLVDFGAVGTLTDDDLSKLTGLFIDAANENIDQIPRRLADLGVRYPREREGEFLAEIRELYYRYYGASLNEIDPIQVIREGFQLIYSMNLHLPARFLMLDRTIATLGSVGTELYPEFNVFEVARPYARDLMLERYAPKRVARRARREVINYARVVAEAPYQFHDFMEEIRDGQIEVGFVHKGLDEFLEAMQNAINRLVIALIVVGGLIGSSLIGIFAKGGTNVLGVNVISIAGFVLSTVLGIWLLWGVIRSGRL
jgi:ubiquinone biosynthesis protein